MSLGVHFALNKKDHAKLLALTDEEERKDYLYDVIEERDDDWSFDTDKAWVAIDFCFSNPDASDTDASPSDPLSLIILGGQSLTSSGDDHMWLKTPEQVQQIAERLKTVTESDLRSRYRAINPDLYGMALSPEDEDYTWEYFAELADFYRRAAKAKRPVLFSAS